MKGLLAAIMGLCSGLLIYFMAAMLIMEPATGREPGSMFVLLTLFGGWVVSAVLLMRGAQTLSSVFRRGFLLGAAEWLAMAAVGLVFSSRIASDAVSRVGVDSGAAAAGAAIGGGLTAALVGGVAVFMSVVCLIGFAISYFIGKEMKDRSGTSTRKCPECAEMIQAEAKRCRYCGTSILASPAPTGNTPSS